MDNGQEGLRSSLVWPYLAPGFRPHSAKATTSSTKGSPPRPAAEPWPGGLWLLRVSHCPPPQGQPFPEGPPRVSALPVSSRQRGPINLFPSTPVPLSEFHRKCHRGSNPSGFRRLAACRDRKTLVFSALVSGPLPRLKQTDEDVLACHKGLQSAGQHREGATSRSPIYRQGAEKEGFRKDPRRA